MLNKNELAQIMIGIPRICGNCFQFNKCDYNYCFECYKGEKWALSLEAALKIAEKILNKLEIK